jgi:LAS superfamily LD-carboxypeptidase LdcB
MLAAGVAAAWYGYEEFKTLSQRVAVLEQRSGELAGQFASTTASLQSNITETSTTLSASLQKQGESVASVTNTVSTLEKLQKLDPQLLAKYSKVYFLNENYAPERLAVIPHEYRYVDETEMQIIPQVLPHLTAMLDAANKKGVTLYVFSAYRSFYTQEALKQQYKVTYGAGTANQFSADQGYSEHQLGTAIDLITTGLGGELTPAFDQTEAYAWLADNAHKYGFTLSYPKGNSYYIYEPWHWRFVGVTLATKLYTDGDHFYDLDQRTIDTYLINIFD